MKMLAVVLTALIAFVLFQSFRHDCHWRGQNLWAQWTSCILDIPG